MRRFISRFGSRLSVIPCLLAASLFAEQRPNIVLILADDLGWADLPLYGNTFHETPALDRLAAEGMRFTQFYAGAVCSPTRANIQTGQHEARFGITQHIPGHKRPFAKLIDPTVPLQLPLEVETFAEILGAAGYATGYFGKWHLGGEGHGPDAQGWEKVFEWQKHEVPAAIAGTAGSWRTANFLTEKAVGFIEANRDRPFVVQVSHYAVHIPLSTTPELLKKYRNKPPMSGYPSLPEYAGLLEELDQSVGGIVSSIARLGLTERTLVVFISDNGGLEHSQSGSIYTSNRPLRGEKGMLYEGGIRIPAIMSWPGVISPGQVCETPVVTTDLYPTFLELAGVDIPEKFPLDGVSLAAVLRKPGSPLGRDALFWHLPHYHHSTPASAIRKGDWKLIEFLEEGETELYNLALDFGESKNLAELQPRKLAELLADLTEWRETVGARMPYPNPDFDPERATLMGPRKKNR